MRQCGQEGGGQFLAILRESLLWKAFKLNVRC